MPTIRDNIIKDESSAESLQSDIDSVNNWTKEWLMKLNSRKCKVMYFGNKNVESIYFIDDLSNKQRINFKKSDCERDLGVIALSEWTLIMDLKKNL